MTRFSKKRRKKNEKVDKGPNRAISPLFGGVEEGREERTRVGGQSSTVTKIHANDNM